MSVTEVAPDRHEVLDGPGYCLELIASDLNRRLQVKGGEVDDVEAAVAALGDRATASGYGKVFWKVRSGLAEPLEGAGFVREAVIPGFFAGDDAAVMGLFVDPERAQQPHLAEEEEILAGVTARPPAPEPKDLPPGYAESVAGPADADDLAGLYRQVFASYPYPIFDPAYLARTMASHIVYRLIRDGDGRLVAAASGEMMAEHHNAEMTDFATLPDQRGHGLALRLLAGLEEAMEARGIGCRYTIARARSFGMNRVFHNRGYRFSGTLVNNCHISGDFEDMHVWHAV